MAKSALPVSRIFCPFQRYISMAIKEITRNNIRIDSMIVLIMIIFIALSV
ncbi:hypothetical protein [Faecalitalea cylindroides]|nr:hypothetical protein [Faecalitalea cylindroides]